MADLDGFKVTFDGYEAEQIAGLPAENHLVEVLDQARQPDLYQRVYDVGGSQWVYYTKKTSDPAPLASETQPNHTGGSLTDHQILLKIFD